MLSATCRSSFVAAAAVVVCACTMPQRRAAVAAPAQGDALPATARRPLMRFPDIHGDTIIFVYGNDIWSVAADGGDATRLTFHDGAERFPKFSPDGDLIAFTGEYDGNGDVYVMDSGGGNIRRVTYHPGFDQVIGWHPKSGKILFRSARSSFSRFNRLFLISPDGTGLETLILNEAATGSFSPDASKIAYNKTARENRTWKRYRGGRAQEVYIYDFATDTDTNVTNFDGTDRIPMWIGDKVYFTSDRDRVLNIYSVDPATRRVEQLTHHTDYDARRPSAGGTSIVYEVGGSLWVLDVTTKRTRQVPVAIRADAEEARPHLESVADRITGFDVSPSGKRALIVARGEIFSVPRKDGPTRNLTADCGARDKDAAWSPDGKTVAYFSDKRGEYELYLVDAKGKTEAVRWSRHKDGYRHTLRWSPDSKKIAFADQTLRCYYLDVKTKKITEIDRAEFENVDVSLDVKPIYDFAWSPDSRYIAYSKMNADLVFQIHIYALDTGRSHRVSNGLFNDFHPTFTRDGEHLLFVSNRRFDPTFCDFEWEMVYKDVAGLYAMTLRDDGPSILPYKSDEEEVEEDDDAADDEADENAAADHDDADTDDGAGNDDVVIDFDGIAGRVEALPLSRGNYRTLATNDGAVFYLNAADGDFNRFEYRAVGPRNLYRFSFDDREEATVVKGVSGYRISADGKTIVYRKGDSIGLVSASATASDGDKLDLSDLQMWLD
ncbi:MAG: peptidase S41, partial [Phycisphaerae bacterium]